MMIMMSRMTVTVTLASSGTSDRSCRPSVVIRGRDPSREDSGHKLGREVSGARRRRAATTPPGGAVEDGLTEPQPRSQACQCQCSEAASATGSGPSPPAGRRKAGRGFSHPGPDPRRARARHLRASLQDGGGCRSRRPRAGPGRWQRCARGALRKPQAERGALPLQERRPHRRKTQARSPAGQVCHSAEIRRGPWMPEGAK